MKNEIKSWFRADFPKRSAWLILAALTWSVSAFGTQMTWNEADVILDDDVRYAYGAVGAGDFNGDNRSDLIYSADGKIMILLGQSWPATGTAVPLVDWTIIFSSMQAKVLVLADFNKDGRDDLILGDGSTLSNQGRVVVVLGRSGEGGVIDFSNTPPDVIVNGTANSELGKSVAAGDFNGDGYRDVLIGTFSGSKAYILWGADLAEPKIVNLPSTDGVTTIAGPAGYRFGAEVAAGDVNGDGKWEAVISDTHATANSIYAGAGIVYLIWGSSPYAPTLQLQIHGRMTGQGLRSPSVEDFDGDQLADILLWSVGDAGLGKGATQLIPGIGVSSTTTMINTLPGGLNYQPMTVLGHFYPPNGFGDFDGDGRADIFGTQVSGYTYPPTLAFLSSDHPGTWDPTEVFGPSMMMDFGGLGYNDYKSALHDLNNDGHRDLIVCRTAIPSYSPSRLLAFYGFQPLKNPRIEIAGRIGNARIDLALSVGANRSEMKLGGDIIDAFRDQWIPFGAKHAVTLSPSPGDKTVTAVFRNTLKRESDPAQAMVHLTPGRTGVEMISNRVRSGGQAVVECPIETAGRLRVTVWTSDGDRVVDLVDEDREPGVWTLEWDGKNNDGKRAAPGVYIMQMEINGHVEQKKILLQG